MNPKIDPLAPDPRLLKDATDAQDPGGLDKEAARIKQRQRGEQLLPPGKAGEKIDVGPGNPTRAQLGLDPADHVIDEAVAAIEEAQANGAADKDLDSMATKVAQIADKYGVGNAMRRFLEENGYAPDPSDEEIDMGEAAWA